MLRVAVMRCALLFVVLSLCLSSDWNVSPTGQSFRDIELIFYTQMGFEPFDLFPKYFFEWGPPRGTWGQKSPKTCFQAGLSCRDEILWGGGRFDAELRKNKILGVRATGGSGGLKNL